MQRCKISKVVRLIRDQTGTAFVEATIMVPVLLILFLGVFEFSYVFYQQQLIEIGVRDAARYLSRTKLDNSSDTPCNHLNLVANAQRLATTGSIDLGTPPRVCTAGICWNTGDVDVTCPASTGAGGPYVLPNGAFGTPRLIRVHTSFRDPSFGLFSFFGLTRPNISFTHFQRYIGSEQPVPLGP